VKVRVLAREPYGIRPEGGRALFTYLWLACRFLRSAVRSRCDVAPRSAHGLTVVHSSLLAKKWAGTAHAEFSR